MNQHPSTECACGKNSYLSRSSAIRAKRKMRNRNSDTGCEAYECPQGNGWHIGHPMGTRHNRQFRRERFFLTQPRGIETLRFHSLSEIEAEMWA